jgi:beta-lactam-binding protein with PASTA domain
MSNPVDTSGNVAVDFVWGNLPLQPDDKRVTSPTQTTTVGAAQNHSWTYVSTKPSAKIDPTQDTEVIADEAWSAFPGFVPNEGVPASSTSITIPNVAGYGYKHAVEALVLAGANVGTVTYRTSGATLLNNGTVYSTSVTGSHTEGTATNLVVYTYQDASTPGITHSTAIGPWTEGTVAG